MNRKTPEQIVDELDIAGLTLEDAKRAIAAAIRRDREDRDSDRIKTRGELVAEQMICAAAGNVVGFRFASGVWGKANLRAVNDAEETVDNLRKIIAAAIDAERKAERERCANAVDQQIAHDSQAQIDLNSAVRRILALPD